MDEGRTPSAAKVWYRPTSSPKICWGHEDVRGKLLSTCTLIGRERTPNTYNSGRSVFTQTSRLRRGAVSVGGIQLKTKSSSFPSFDKAQFKNDSFRHRFDVGENRPVQSSQHASLKRFPYLIQSPFTTHAKGQGVYSRCKLNKLFKTFFVFGGQESLIKSPIVTRERSITVSFFLASGKRTELTSEALKSLIN